MKALIAGLGSIGVRHLRNLHALGLRDILAFRVRAEQVDEVERFGVSAYYDLDQALDQRPDAVFVTNPTSAHLQVALAAARRGCHLFIEKPLSHDLAGVDDLINIVRAKRLVAQVGCNFRFNPALRRVRTYLKERTVGRAVTVRAHAGEYLPDWHPGEEWRSGYSARRDLGGGVILTVIHELDYLCWFFGEVTRVFAMAGAWSDLELEVEDAAEILLEFASGVCASIHLDYVQRPPARTLEVVAERGTIRWDFHTGRLALYSADTCQWSEWAGPTFERRNDMYVDELRHFLDCVAGRSEPMVSLEEGKRVLEVALGAKRSSSTGEFLRFKNVLAGASDGVTRTSLR